VQIPGEDIEGSRYLVKIPADTWRDSNAEAFKLLGIAPEFIHFFSSFTFVHCFHFFSFLFTVCSLLSFLFISFHFLHYPSLEKNANPDHLHVDPLYT